MGSRRSERVAALIRQELASLMLTGTKDDVLASVEVTGVRVTPDLQIAHVSYVIVDADPEETAAALARSSSFLRRELAGRVNLRRAPILKFHLDKGLENASKIEALFQRLHEEGQMGGSEEGGDES